MLQGAAYSSLMSRYAGLKPFISCESSVLVGIIIKIRLVRYKKLCKCSHLVHLTMNCGRCVMWLGRAFVCQTLQAIPGEARDSLYRERRRARATTYR